MLEGLPCLVPAVVGEDRVLLREREERRPGLGEASRLEQRQRAQELLGRRLGLALGEQGERLGEAAGVEEGLRGSNSVSRTSVAGPNSSGGPAAAAGLATGAGGSGFAVAGSAVNAAVSSTTAIPVGSTTSAL